MMSFEKCVLLYVLQYWNLTLYCTKMLFLLPPKRIRDSALLAAVAFTSRKLHSSFKMVEE